MEEKEYKVLKYVYETIKGNSSEYLSDINDDEQNQEIGYYIEILIQKGYIMPSNDKWAIRNGHINKKYNNNIWAILYEKLCISPKGEDIIKEFSMYNK